MPKLVTIDIDALQRLADEAQAAWQTSKAALDETVAYAATHHVSPGDGYWQEESRLRHRYEALREICAALCEAAG